MNPVHVRLRVLGGNPLHGSDALGLTDGDFPWNLSLGRHTGDGKFDGEIFLGRLWMFFLGVGTGGEGQEEAPGHDCRGAFAGRREFQTTLFMLYIICCGVEVSLLYPFQVIAKSALDLDALDRHVRC
jgi:hypothetical protein